MRQRHMTNKDNMKAFHVVSFEEDSYPDLTGYSENEYIAKEYASQWLKRKPMFHTVYGLSIADACRDDISVSSHIKNFKYMSDDDEIRSMHLIDNDLKKIVGGPLSTEYFLYTNSQITDISDCGIDVIDEAGTMLVLAVENIRRLAKYVRDPIFKQLIDFIMNKYITIIAVLELSYGYGTDVDYTKLSKLSHKIPYAYDDNFPFDVGEFMDLFYLDYIAIKNNAT